VKDAKWKGWLLAAELRKGCQQIHAVRCGLDRTAVETPDPVAECRRDGRWGIVATFITRHGPQQDRFSK
jgi:hypothetical protein